MPSSYILPMTDIPITREEHDGRGRYVALVEGNEAELTWTLDTRNGHRLLIANHTGVPSALSGRGVGLALVRRAVEDARAEGVRIVPQCSFVRVMIQRHKDLQDVLATEEQLR